MSSRNDDPKLNAQLDATYLLGQAVSLENLSGDIRHRSGQVFANGKDVEANWLRKLAKEIDEMALDIRKKYAAKRTEAEAT